MPQAIRCVVGDVGSGKTLYVVVKAIEAAQQGREVFMNFPLKPEFKKDYPELAKHIHYLEDFYKFLEDRERQARQTPMLEFQDLFVVDEAWAIWNSRLSMTSLQTMTTNYIFISRKIGLELLMSSQLASNLDKRAKLLVQVWLVATKLLYEGKCYFQYEYYQPELGEIKTTYLAPDVAAQYYPYYDTTQQTSVGPQVPIGSEEAEDTSRPVSARQFGAYKKKMSTTLKALQADLRAIRKELKHNGDMEKKSS